VGLQEPAGQLGELRRDAQPVGQVADGLPGHAGGHGEHDPDRVRRDLGVLQLAQRRDVRAGLGDPVAAGDAEVEQAFRDVRRDLLGPQEPDSLDARIVDGRMVITVGRAPNRQVCGVEQVEGGALQ
jgi:hypothetical protein